jgi:hypothetical protein
MHSEHSIVLFDMAWDALELAGCGRKPLIF